MNSNSTNDRLDMNHKESFLVQENGKKKNQWLSFERNEIFLLLSFFFFGIAGANFEPYAPVWLSRIFQEQSFLVIGLAVIIPSVVLAIGSPFWGFLADKFGSKKFVLIGFGAYTITNLILVFTTSSMYFLIVILIGYLFCSAQTSNFYAFATKSINKHRSTILAKLTATVSISWIITSPIAAKIYDILVERAMVVQLSIASLACLISFLLIFFVKENVELIKKDNVIENKNMSEKKVINPLTMVPVLFASIIIIAFSFQMTSGFWGYSIIYFVETLEVKAIYFSVYIIAKTAMAIPLSYILGRIKTKERSILTVMIFVCWIVLINLIAFLNPRNWLLILIFFSVPMYPLFNVIFYSLTSSFSSKEKRATAFGLLNAAGIIGYVSGILILGTAADKSSEGIFVMLKISLIIAVVTSVVTLVFVIYTLLLHKIRKVNNIV